MKRIIATLLCALFLFGTFAVSASAADGTDIQFSMKGAEGKPGDVINVEVYLDKNAGTWACYFEVRFNERYFTLISVDNGDVYSDGEFVKSILTNRGKYIYYAEASNYDSNNTNTGLILTLTFEITENAPAGENNMTLFFPDDGKGWFFDGSEFPDFVTEYTVSCSNAAVITVEKDETADTDTPDTEIADGTTAADEETTAAPDEETTDAETTAPGVPVTDKVYDEEGNVVTNEAGEEETQVVTDANGDNLYYETDEEGSIVTDENGEDVVVAVPETSAPETTLPGVPVTDYIFDTDGSIVTNEAGDRETYQATDANGVPLYYVTDAENNVVTDANGNNVVIAVPDTTAAPETTASPETTAAPETTASPETTAAPVEEEAPEPISPYKIILIASIAAVIVGAIIVVIVMSRPGKKEEKK